MARISRVSDSGTLGKTLTAPLRFAVTAFGGMQKEAPA